MGDTSQTRCKIFRSAFRIAAALLFLSLAVPVLGQNYTLHSPKLWTPQEKELYDKEFRPARKELTPIQMEKVPAQKLKVPKKVQQVKVQPKPKKVQPLREQILVRDGVSYREVRVQKGDTLAKISRRYRKNDPTYADILRFNAMKSSEVIRCGDIIKLPVTVTSIKPRQPVQELKPAGPAASNRQAAVKPAAGPIRIERPAALLKKPDAAGNGVLAAKAVTQPFTLPVNSAPTKTGLLRNEAFPGITTARQTDKRPTETVVLKPVPAQAVPVSAKPDTEKTQASSGTAVSGEKLFELAVKSYRQGDCVTAVRLFARFLVENTDSLFAPDASLFNADCYLKLSGK